MSAKKKNNSNNKKNNQNLNADNAVKSSNSKQNSNNTQNSTKNKVENKVTEKKVSNESNVDKKTEEIIFKSPSAAASFILGRSANGRNEYMRTKDNKTFQDSLNNLE